MNIEIFEKLLEEQYFVESKKIDNLVPDKPGFYCINIINKETLPEPFPDILTKSNSDCLYFGLASKSLRKRFLDNEMRGNGHGTFFRSIGSVLGFLPPKGSLLTKKNKRNYKFNTHDTSKIVEWLNKNTKVNWIVWENGNHSEIESILIKSAKPLLNIAKNKNASDELKILREKCVRYAN